MIFDYHKSSHLKGKISFLYNSGQSPGVNVTQIGLKCSPFLIDQIRNVPLLKLYTEVKACRHSWCFQKCLISQGFITKTEEKHKSTLYTLILALRCKTVTIY